MLMDNEESSLICTQKQVIKNRNILSAALRFGDFKQANGQLLKIYHGTEKHYCCLGVAQHLTDPKSLESFEVAESAYSPKETRDKYGFDQKVYHNLRSGTVRLYDILASMNDRSCSFSEIADYIDFLETQQSKMKDFDTNPSNHFHLPPFSHTRKVHQNTIMNNNSNNAPRKFNYEKIINSFNAEMKNKVKIATPKFYTDRNYTVCRLVFGFFLLEHKNTQMVGVAKRNPNDQANPYLGKKLALQRAINNIMEEYRKTEKKQHSTVTKMKLGEKQKETSLV